MCELDSVDAAFSWYGETKTTVSLIKFQLYKKSGKKSINDFYNTDCWNLLNQKYGISLVLGIVKLFTWFSGIN